MASPLLFTPLTIRGLPLKNRIVVPPMIQCQARDGVANDWHLVHAGRFAAGGAGLVILESTKVERRGCGNVGDLGLWDDGHVAPLSRVVDFIKQHGAAAGIQLGHTGRKGRTHLPWDGGGPLADGAGIDFWEEWELIAPSALAYGEGWPTPRALSRVEIGEVVEAWGRAAERALKAGFDVLEIHGAHGYLIHQFLSPVANVRDDEYGGSQANRMRFALQVAERVRRSWPADKPLFTRLSIEDHCGWGPAENVVLARELKRLGVDVIDCTTGGITSDAPNMAGLTHYGYQVPFAETVRRDADILTMAVGLIIHGDQADEILQRGQADLIAVGREMLHNPNWAMDAAQKLGLDTPFQNVPEQVGFWLATRARRGFGCNPSTWQRGLGATEEETA